MGVPGASDDARMWRGSLKLKRVMKKTRPKGRMSMAVDMRKKLLQNVIETLSKRLEAHISHIATGSRAGAIARGKAKQKSANVYVHMKKSACQ